MAGSRDELNFKTIFLGDRNAGKSALVNRLTKKQFTSSPDVTLEITTSMSTYQKHIVKNRFFVFPENINKVLYLSYITNPEADAVVLVFDLTNQDSFNNLNKYLAYIKEVSPRSSLLLVGTKSDRINEQIVSQVDIMRFQKEHKVKYLATSAKNNTNVSEFLTLITKTIYDKKRMAIFDNAGLPQRRGHQLHLSEVDLNDPSEKLLSKRSALEGKLLEYINRIDGYTDLNKNIDYKRGFWFFARQRGNNRRVNYRLASDLLTALRTTTDPIAKIFGNLEAKRDLIIKTLKLTDNDFIATGINSAELKDIVNDALKEDSEEQSLLNNDL